MNSSFPVSPREKTQLKHSNEVPQLLWDFMERFDVQTPETKEGKFAQGLYGYTTYDAVQFFDTIRLKTQGSRPDSYRDTTDIPLMRYRLYQYVIAINHFKDELFICENKVPGVESELAVLESLIRSKDIPAYPFRSSGEESSNMTDEDYKGDGKKRNRQQSSW